MGVDVPDCHVGCLPQRRNAQMHHLDGYSSFAIIMAGPWATCRPRLWYKGGRPLTRPCPVNVLLTGTCAIVPSWTQVFRAGFS